MYDGETKIASFYNFEGNEVIVYNSEGPLGRLGAPLTGEIPGDTTNKSFMILYLL